MRLPVAAAVGIEEATIHLTAFEAGPAVAMIAGAIRAYQQDEAEERTKFLASAARGRPEVGDEIGRSVTLRASGIVCRLRVLRVGPDRFVIEAPEVRIQAEVQVGPDGAMSLRCPLGRFDVRWLDGDAEVEIDGTSYRVSRDDEGMVCSPAPAVVVGLFVEPGMRVAEGDTLAVLEAMKMEMSIVAPSSGTVRRVLVGTNVQVGHGQPLFQLSTITEEEAAAGAASLFGSARWHEDPSMETPPRRQVLEELRRLILGFDLEAGDAKTLVARWLAASDGSEDDEPRPGYGEDELLEVFADVCSLGYRTSAPVGGEAGASYQGREDELFTYLRSVRAGDPALSAAFLDDLLRALSHCGVASLDRTPQLEDALFHLYRSLHRADEQAPMVMAILDRWLERLDDGPPQAAAGRRGLLDRLIVATEGRHPAVNDVAREVRHRSFDQPMLEEARKVVYAEVEAALAELAANPTLDPSRHIAALVSCPQPLKRMLTSSLQGAPAHMRPIMLEVLVRRYFRIRALEDVRSSLVDGRAVLTARYPHDGTAVSLVAVHGTLAGFDGAAAAAARAVSGAPAGDDVVVELYLWRDGPPEEPDRTSRSLAEALERVAFGRTIRRVVVAISGAGTAPGLSAMEHFTFRPAAGQAYEEETLYRGLHPMMGKRLDLWRLSNFWIDRLPSVEDVFLFHAVARENPKDERLFALAEVRDLTPILDAQGRVTGLPHLERMLTEAFVAIRRYQSHRPAGARLQWNRVLLYVWPPVDLDLSDLSGIVHRMMPLAAGLGLEKVAIRIRVPDTSTGELHDQVMHISDPAGRGLAIRVGPPADRPIRPLSVYLQKVVRTRQRGLTYPYEIVRMLTASPDTAAELPPGAFEEWDLDEDEVLVPVHRPYGENAANVVVGIIRSFTAAYPEGMPRVALLGDPSRNLGSLAEPECRRIVAALDLAQRLNVPLEWYAVSAGARIAMQSGTENMDWIGRVLRRLILFTQAGGEVNVIVCGINVGAQPYWNAEATMLMHTKGILIMTPDSAMVLTGKQALDYSGGVSAEDNAGIGGYERVMGPNGQAQYRARDLHEACEILFRHYEHAYVQRGERFPRRVHTDDPPGRDVRLSPHRPGGESGFRLIADVFSDETNPGRKKPFDIRSVMRAVVDADHRPLERWQGMRDAEIAVVWDAHLGGFPVSLIGIESRPLPRHDPAPADGPEHWTSGTLFPLSSKKIARAINAASGSRPVVVLANLSGFDGSPESLRSLQLEYGAEIGRAVVNFRGPMVFCVVARYHGGAFVVFSKTLNESLEIAAVEGSFASVIGGAPAAAVVFSREVDERTKADERVRTVAQAAAEAGGAEKRAARARLGSITAAVRSEKLGEVAAEFDREHSVYRALRVGSVDRIVAAAELRPYLIDAVERGTARELLRIEP